MNTQEIYEHLQNKYDKLNRNLELAISEGRESDQLLILARLEIVSELASKIDPPSVWVA